MSSAAVAAMNGSSSEIRLAAIRGSTNLRWAAWIGSSAVASTWIGLPGSPMPKAVTVPSGCDHMVAVRFDEKSSVRAVASRTASNELTTKNAESPTRATGDWARSRS